ncbi:DUF4124 domain-containing protein [Zoogloea sp.]|uniref:DUF4124 domain-containing protein n=1 Tax=Zoogloea sp. TaxID=49181 RepID=UPI002616B902|nr:DUF4124 domain-containing protein [Zoogloea sp.]MDD3353627.1 DUF4124 domain-containing protein [Zoogloea sp.]
MHHRLFAGLLACASSLALAQGVYSWKDASGRVHYSDLPPPGLDVRTVSKPSLPPPARDNRATPAASAPPSYVEKEQAFRKRRAEAAEAEEKARKEQISEELRARECSESRAQLAGLESTDRVVRFGENGERLLMNQEEREAEINRTRRAMERACK